MSGEIKPYAEMTIPELRETVKELLDRQHEADSAHRQADTYLRNRVIREAKERVAEMPQDERDALREALAKRP